MPQAALPPPILIADPAALNRLARDLSRQPAVGVDTESNSLYAYRERVCLVQFSTPTHDYIVDALPLPDLSALAPLFANARQQKIFHAAEYDLLCLKRDYGFAFAHLFDTMVAARTLGWPQMGLAAILEARFGVKMNKKLQRADWGRRPLAPELLDYARLDTHYLRPLHDMLAAELSAAGRQEEAQEEFARLERVAPSSNNQAHAGYWRINGARDLAPAQVGVLRELFVYRERQAKRADRPPFKVMGEQTLLEIARTCPRTAAELQELPGMTPAQMRRHSAGLLQAVRRGRSEPPPHQLPQARESESVRERFDRLQQWRKRKARARGVESDVIVPREALWELARRAPRTPEELHKIEHLGPWRRQTYGAEILALLDQRTRSEPERERQAK